MTSASIFANCPSRQKTIEKTCPSCGQVFLVSKKKIDQKTCSRTCSCALRLGRVGDIAVKTCPVCKKTFRSHKDATRKYCSPGCCNVAGEKREARWNVARELTRAKCAVCGKEFLPANPRKKINQITCSRECWFAYYRDDSGTVRDSAKGYKRVKTEDGKWRQEHCVIAEKMIGRPLTKEEVVHHRNGKKGDNRKENLQVVTKSEHSTIHQMAERIGNTLMAQCIGLPILAGEWIHPLEGCEV